MSPTLQLLLLLSIIIAAAKMAGYFSARLGQPAVLGELLMGLVLGPTVLDLLHAPVFVNGHIGEMILELGELGVIFLMFIAGLEVDLDGMIQSGRVAVIAGVMGVLTPLVFGAIVAYPFGYAPMTSVFIGLVLTATSVSISAQTLLELGMLKTKEGLALLGAAVIDDVLVILVLSIFLALTGDTNAGAGNIALVVLRMGAFLGIAILLGILLIPRLAHWVEELPISEGVMALVVIVTLLFAWSAEVVGEIAAITGAFLAGVFFARTSVRHTIERGMHTLTYAFFVPIFLISIGLKANARTLGIEGLFFAAVIIIVAILGKVIGSGFGARIAGFNTRESLRVGVGMISRGEVGLIVAAIGLNENLISQQVYSTMVVMVLATTLVTPVFLRGVFAKTEASNGKPARSGIG
ncbi:MAG: cation:proton antiporter [Chloroflexi bacterium]|nr:cation:proton antiporter [Chloroflexota bacterium]